MSISFEQKQKCEGKARKLVHLLHGISYVEWCAIQKAVDDAFEEEKRVAKLNTTGKLFNCIFSELCKLEKKKENGNDRL